MNLKKYIAELKRRNVFKAGIAYLVVASIIAEVASVVLPTFNAPDYLLKILLIILFIGFPINLVFAWIYDITQEGIKKTEDIDQEAQNSSKRVSSWNCQVNPSRVYLSLQRLLKLQSSHRMI